MAAPTSRRLLSTGCCRWGGWRESSTCFLPETSRPWCCQQSGRLKKRRRRKIRWLRLLKVRIQYTREIALKPITEMCLCVSPLTLGCTVRSSHCPPRGLIEGIFAFSLSVESNPTLPGSRSRMLEGHQSWHQVGQVGHTTLQKNIQIIKFWCLALNNYLFTTIAPLAPGFCLVLSHLHFFKSRTTTKR